MKMRSINLVDDIKTGDQLLITGDVYTCEPFKAELVKVSESYGTEVIIDLKNNRYFNVGMYLKGISWVKDIVKIEP